MDIDLAMLTASGCAICGKPPLRYLSGQPMKYCSEVCRGKAHTLHQKARYNTDPEYRKLRRIQARACWKRTKEQRPEDYRAAYRKKLENPLYRIAKSHRNRLQELIKKGATARTGSATRLFGCTLEHLRNHLESLFTRGMAWENYGEYWHVDHIIPLAKFDLTQPAQKAIAFNWQNLRPLKAEKNQQKSDKITDPQQSLPLVIT
jgi:5-methylcytosine-specific restriction endonuclease McrA